MANATRAEKLLAGLSYLPFLVFLPFFFVYKNKSSDFLLFHVNRGLVLLIVECCLFVPTAILAHMLKSFWYPIGTVVYILIFLLALVFIFLSLCGMVFAFRSQMHEIPIFNKCTILKK